MGLVDIIRHISFGEQVAEHESLKLAEYFAQTESWRIFYSGNIDIIYGAKGSGKSAIYTYLLTKKEELLEKNIILASAEKLRGTPAFKILTEIPPTPEKEFISLWKLYFLQLIGEKFQERQIKNCNAMKVVNFLKKSRLLTPRSTLRDKISSASKYIKKLAKIKSFGGELKIDPNTGLPSGIAGTITLDDTFKATDQTFDYCSIHDLYKFAEKALEEENFSIWIVIDRLDVAFDQNERLERNALRALFKAYLDMLGHDKIKIKIFLRDDIWKRITTKRGFREASHITKALTIEWDNKNLLNLLIRRLLKNRLILEYYNVEADEILGDTRKQSEFFYEVFPAQIESGQKKLKTFDWILNRIRDAKKKVAPREMIHFLKELRTNQMEELELGSYKIQAENLFSKSSIIKSLLPVSKAKLDQTLFQEYPQYRDCIMKFEQQKTEHSLSSLQRLWDIGSEKTVELSRNLFEIGFLERKGDIADPTFTVPYLYRLALNMVQGKAYKKIISKKRRKPQIDALMQKMRNSSKHKVFEKVPIKPKIRIESIKNYTKRKDFPFCAEGKVLIMNNQHYKIGFTTDNGRTFLAKELKTGIVKAFHTDTIRKLHGPLGMLPQK